MRTLTLVTGFEPARPSFEEPTSQGHHTFPYLVTTLTPVSEHLLTYVISSNPLQVYPFKASQEQINRLEKPSFT